MSSQEFSITLETARDALMCIPSHERETWVKMAKALHDEFGEAAFDIWDEWSRGAESYKERDAKTVWKSVGRMASGKRPVTIGSVIYAAQQRGFTLKRSQQVTRTAEEIARLTAEREARREAARLAEEQDHRKAAEAAAAIWGAAEPVRPDHPYLARKGVRPYHARWVSQWVKEFTDDETGEIRKVTVGDAMLVPIWSAPGTCAREACATSSSRLGKSNRRNMRGLRAFEGARIITARVASVTRRTKKNAARGEERAAACRSNPERFSA